MPWARSAQPFEKINIFLFSWTAFSRSQSFFTALPTTKALNWMTMCSIDHVFFSNFVCCWWTQKTVENLWVYDKKILTVLFLFFSFSSSSCSFFLFLFLFFFLSLSSSSSFFFFSSSFYSPLSPFSFLFLFFSISFPFPLALHIDRPRRLLFGRLQLKKVDCQYPGNTPWPLHLRALLVYLVTVHHCAVLNQLW